MKALKIYLAVIVLILISFILAFFSCHTKKNDKRLEILDHIDQKIDYFRNENIDRYVSYHLNHKHLSLSKAVLYVNIGLDFPFYEHSSKALNPYTNLVLVNKYHALDKAYIPPSLQEIYAKYSSNHLLLVEEACFWYEKMAKEMEKEGLYLRVISSYRSYSYQEKLYNKYVALDGIKKADQYSARPGFSEHQTGLVIDCDNGVTSYEEFGNTKEFQWMQKHAYQYGFILRYPKGKEMITGYTYEPWHYRYVGREVATVIERENITFDEYIAKQKK